MDCSASGLSSSNFANNLIKSQATGKEEARERIRKTPLSLSEQDETGSLYTQKLKASQNFLGIEACAMASIFFAWLQCIEIEIPKIFCKIRCQKGSRLDPSLIPRFCFFFVDSVVLV
jgi:hypothetical protein